MRMLEKRVLGKKKKKKNFDYDVFKKFGNTKIIKTISVSL